MNIYKNSAYKVLSGSDKPLHYREITKKALEMGILETVGATPEASMNAQISVDIKQNGSTSIFARLSPGHYSLNKNAHKQGIKNGNNRRLCWRC